MFKVSKSFQFDAAHRLLNYSGKCSNLHGHTYRVVVTVGCMGIGAASAPSGMVVDFTTLSNTLGSWIDQELDHAVLLHNDDFTLRGFLDMERMRYFLMGGNPTAENIADLLFNKAHSYYAAYEGVQVCSVDVYETPTSCARRERCAEERWGVDDDV